MANLIVGVVMDVLVHVPIQHFDSIGVGLTPRSAWHFGILDSGELVVLLPQIGLDDFCRRQESENGGIALVQAAERFSLTLFCGKSVDQQSCAHRYCSGGE